MTRAALLLSASLALLMTAGAAGAQDLREIQARNAAAQAVEDARRDMLSNQIETSNANERAATQSRLRDLGGPRVGVVPGAVTVPPVQPVEDPGRRDAALVNSMDRMERLTQDALAQSNARMRSIRPASEPKN
jgi:hypothetical protein